MNKKINKFSKYLNLINENRERDDDANFLLKNKKFISELADTAFIGVGFVNKKLSSLEQGSLIAGEVEYLNRFKNFKEFLGNTNLNVKPKTGTVSISSHLKRIITEYDEVLDSANITKYNQKLFSTKKQNALDALKIIDELINILNVSYAKMKKIRKKNSLVKKIKKIVLKQNNKKEFEEEKNLIFANIRNCIVSLEPKLQHIDFRSFLSSMSKLKIIESSMGR